MIRVERAAVSVRVRSVIESPETPAVRRIRRVAFRVVVMLLSLMLAGPVSFSSDDQTETFGGIQPAELQEARRLAAAGRIEAAAAAYRRYLDTAPDSAAARSELGQVLLAMQRPGDSLEHFRAAVELEPGNADTLSRYAQALILTDHIAEAEQILLEARRSDPMLASVRYNLARIMEVQQRHEEALAEYVAFLDMAPDDSRATGVRVRVAIYFENTGRLDQALEQYDEILIEDPGNLRALQSRADILYRRTRYDEALTIYERVLALEPGTWSAHANAGFIYRLRGDIDRAVMHYRMSTELSPDNVSSHYFLGTLYADLARDDQAMERFMRVVELEEDHPLVHYAIGRILVKRGDREGASREFDRHRHIQAAARARSRTASSMDEP